MYLGKRDQTFKCSDIDGTKKRNREGEKITDHWTNSRAEFICHIIVTHIGTD
jgi:hypothetical protein